MSVELAKKLNDDLYPGLKAVGGLRPALQQVLRQLGTDLTVQELDEPLFFVCAVVNHAERFSQVKIAAHQRAFVVDFWHQGVLYGSGLVGDLQNAGAAIVAFNLEGVPAQGMASRFGWFAAKRSALIHQQGSEPFVAEAWQRMTDGLKDETEGWPGRDLLALVREVRNRAQLRQLFPFRSLYSLCFSRTTGFPYTRDCPVVQPIGAGRFLVSSADKSAILGEGELVQVVDILVANLPQNCGPAVHGTAETFK